MRILVVMNRDLTLEDFLKYTFNNVCGCVSSECEINELQKISYLQRLYKNDTKLDCNIIIFEDEPRIQIAEQIIKLFIKSGLLKKKKKVYYLLSTNKRLSWNNIKMLNLTDIQPLKSSVKQEIHDLFTGDSDKSEATKSEATKSDNNLLLFIKGLYWYFRKVIVDSIINDAVLMLKTKGQEVRAMSVGSTSIKSDYDITLDGSYKKTAQIIKTFNSKISDLFHDNTERLFDTNVYGVSFIKGEVPIQTPGLNAETNKIVSDVFNTTIKCKGRDISYIKTTDYNFIDSQHVWALVKMLLKLQTIQKMDDQLYNLFSTELENTFKNAYYLQAQRFINENESNIEHYQESVKDFEKFLERNKSVLKQKENIPFLIGNFISFVNYNGSETYLTNGAFLDVVINSQMCKDGGIQLTDDEYLDSFIENVSEIITHYHKPKYISRAMNSLNNMKFLSYSTKRNVTYLLKQIKKIQSVCARNILKCQSFMIMDYCMKCITSVFSEYTKTQKPQRELKFGEIVFKSF